MEADRCKHGMLDDQCSTCKGLEEPPKYSTAAEILAGALFDYASATPVWTREMAERELGVSASMLSAAIRQLRLILAEDEINLVCEPRAGGWIYKLVGTVDEALPWASIRLRSVEAQLATVAAITKSLVNSTHGNSRDGRRARLIAGQIGMLQMQLEMFAS